MPDITVEITSGSIVVVEMNRGFSGYSGRSGYSGFSGNNPGTSGYSGFSGKSGYSGFSGKSGFSGAGTSGFSGFSGRSGYSGFSGSGQSGYSGFSGAVGLTSYLATTVTYNNNSVLADTALSVTVNSSTKYAITLIVHSTNAVRSLNLDFAGTSSQNSFIGEWAVYDSSDFSNFGQLRVVAVGTDFSAGLLDTLNGYYTFTGSVDVNAGGTFLLRGAQRAADVSNTTILAGSTLVLTKMS